MLFTTVFKLSILNMNMVKTFSDLPEEIVIRIFGNFKPRELCQYVAPVCKRWLIFSRDPLLWREVNSEDFMDVSNELLLDVIFSWCTMLKRLDLRTRTTFTAEMLKILCEKCEILEELSLAFFSQLNDDMIECLSICKCLKKLNVEGCPVSDHSLSNMSSLRKLTELNVSHCNGITDEGLCFIANHFKHLEKINLDGIPWVTSTSIKVLVEHCGKKLTDVILDGAELHDGDIEQISSCPNLRVFSMSFCDNLTDVSLSSILQMKKLKKLILRKGVHFSQKQLLYFTGQMCLSPVPPQSCHQITCLGLAECSELVDSCLYNIAINCPLLVKLDISWCWVITDDGIEAVISSCHSIQMFIVCGLYRLTGIPFKNIPTSTPLLTFLDLTQCNSVTDDLLLELLDEMENLEIIGYYGCAVSRSTDNLSLI